MNIAVALAGKTKKIKENQRKYWKLALE